MSPIVRRATVDDIDELMRLRIVLRTSVGDPSPPPGPWEAQTVSDLRERLPETSGDLAVFVVDGPERRLVSAAFGVVHRIPAMPHRPDGRRGWVSDVVTEPDFRRQGFGRAVLSALIEWFASRGVAEVQLNASPAGARLYEGLGFVRDPDPSYRLFLSPTSPSE